jgi:hypothetical protein
MKTKIIILAVAVAAFSSCRKGDNLYTSPNVPLNVTPGVMITGIEANTFMNYEAGLGRMASVLMQHNEGTNNIYTNYDAYSILPSDMDNAWTGLYVGAMKNCKLLCSQFEANYPYYAGIAHVNMAINLGIATQLWGDVPFSKAFNFENDKTGPGYDAQQAILVSIQNELNLAIADFAKLPGANQVSPGADDLIFKGDVGAWTKTAWVLKARYHNMLSISDPAGSANNVIADLANGMTSNADNCYSAHNSSSDPNQWDAFQTADQQYVTGNQTLIDSLGLTDPRTLRYYDSTGTGTGGLANGIATAGCNFGPYLTDGLGDLPTPLVTYAESQFLLAEAQARIANPSALATLNGAIAASIAEVTKGAGTTYVVTSATVHKVITEKWKAMFGQPLEAYADYRRTGFPQLALRPVHTTLYIPKRMPTPQGELTGNPNAKVISLGTACWFALP